MAENSLDTTGIDHVVFHVRDTERSKAFYTGVLGMTVESEFPGRLRLKCGRQLLALFAAPEGGDFTAHGDVNHVALTVRRGTYEEIRGTLEAAGIEVTGRPGDERCIYFDDPDGHRLQIVVPD